MMDYGEILKSELSRGDVSEADAYDSASASGCGIGGLLKDCEYLLNNVPSEGDIKGALAELASGGGDGVQLLPIRAYLQTRLGVSCQRMDELISDNEWIHSWIEYIRALQDVKIVGEFSTGNMEEGRFKWLLWSVLGERVDLSGGRTSGGDIGGECAAGDGYGRGN
jgi:hypothetical protein